MQDSDAKTKIIRLLSNTYDSLIGTAKEHRSQLKQDEASTGSNSLDDYAKGVISVMDADNTESDKTKHVVNLLEHYSNTIVKLVELKLNGSQ